MPEKMPAYETLSLDRRNGVDWLTLNRPERLNALNATMMLELQDYFQRLYTDHAVRVVVLKGAGRGFCAGADLKETSISEESGPSHGLRVQRRVSEIVMRMRRAPQPIVCLLHGSAAGGGLALALASDIRIAAEGSRVNAAFIKIGLSGCDVGVSYFLPRLVGASIAAEMLMTGRFVDANRALRIGLVSEVVPEAELEKAGQSYVDDLLATAPLALRLTKECLNMSIDAPSLESAIAMEDRNQILTVQSADFPEGVRAFREKRAPKYRDA